jgi:hypothetical protein
MYSDFCVFMTVQANISRNAKISSCRSQLYGYMIFDRGGVNERRIAIGVAMGYKVVASNPKVGFAPIPSIVDS